METSASFEYTSSGNMGPVAMIIWLAFIVLMIVSVWKVFTKAGKPGWASIIPIYNVVVMLEIAGKPIWWIILFFIPIANLVVGILMLAGIAKNFGRGVGTVIGLILLPIVFWPILAFGSAEYKPGAAAPAAEPTPAE